MKSAIIRNVTLCFVRVRLLHHAADEPVFGLAMIEEQRRHGYESSPGKVRKYYTATTKGRRTLAELKKKIKELFGELFQD